ncbi:putative type II secretion system protein E [Selenomonas ruminantium subsp. lactilytica TAM6421]|uniref:Putative type II secretion system protein E n=1 Tax=Selenomonas ruminantium subsp. lactilytica (strain NBRC 103574 / TAM6421) TaxID=927704 RepID=I0GRV3_SELRL|nr:GspE/PulE family protein [Selenomonas ruminantium]BAL83490.1 putative type II secretion system protein E [Selenomonas ruminantium subsp. lactilytica TAM6421]
MHNEQIFDLIIFEEKGRDAMQNEDTFWRILLNQCRQEQIPGAEGTTGSSAAMVRLVDFLILQALEAGASDLHIEPWERSLRFRLRVDGLLQVMPWQLPGDLAPMLVSRIKVLAGMDIAKHQQPQDGAFIFQEQGKKVDIRAASMPVAGGEMLVLRLLNMQDEMLTLSELGFTAENEAKFRELIHRPSGLLIVCGPMGSGKTTTLYAALREVNRVEKNWLTLEDPIERHIQGINQIQVNPQAGLSYANGLRAILRMDAQGILLGEIRDEETAMLAVRMALTGHLILTTLHTESAVAAVLRLLEMKVPPYLLAATLSGVLAQRLVRRCVDKEQELYRGRLALHELMVVDKSIREAILIGQSQEQLEALAWQGGMRTLWSDGEAKAAAGLTTREELTRVL